MINLVNLLDGNASGGNNWTMWIIIGVMVIAFIAMSFFNNKKRKKQAAEEAKKKDALCAGTKIITIGGIIGEVVSVDETEFTMTSGTSTLVMDKRSIYQMTLPEDVQARLDAEKQAEIEAKANKGKKAEKVEEKVEEVVEEKEEKAE